MKKIYALLLALASIGFVASSAEAKDTKGSAAIVSANSVQPQWRNRGSRDRRYNRSVRVTTQTRLVRFGRRIYRETYQIRYLPNGRTVSRLISRVRVR